MRRGVMNVLSFDMFCILLTILQTIIDQSVLNFAMISLEKWGLKGNPKLEIRYAKRIIGGNWGKTPSEIAPGTKVYELVRNWRGIWQKLILTNFY